VEVIVQKQIDHPESSSSRAALGVTELCRSHGISRALFYLLLRDGTGPRVMRVRGRVLISAEAAREWREQMEHMAA
jgi:predicted DNA-binding transcriptional regulator AlpA